MGVDDTNIPEWLRKVREANAEKEAAKPPAFQFPLTDIPGMDDPIPTPALTPEQDEIDRLLAGIDILDAYKRWCGKTMDPKVGSRRESIMVSCPFHHPDKNPSAWINLDKQVINCGGCNQGGDIFTIAAAKWGFSLSSYQSDENFPRLKKLMAEDLGYVIKTTLGGQRYVEQAVVEESEEEPEPSNVVQLPGTQPEYESLDPSTIPTIEWEELIQNNTFLHSYMTSVAMDDIAPEFHLWNALLALGFAAGIDQLLADSLPVKPAINVLLYGDTGSGKSRSLRPFQMCVEDALPYVEDPYNESRGTAILPPPASSEVLIKSFNRDILDQSTQQVVAKAKVRGLIKIDEFASFVARAARPGNFLKQTMIDMFDVIDGEVSYMSVGSGRVIAQAPFCQMVSSTQPQATHEFLRRSDLYSGFLNRFVPVMGKPRRARLSYGGFEYNMTDPVQYLKDVHMWCIVPRKMVLDGDALDAWDSFFHSTLVPIVDREANPMMSRIDLILKKLILLFTINAKEDKPTKFTVEQAIRLFEYLVRTYKIFSGDLAYDVNEECRDAIIALANRPEGIKSRELKRYMSGFSTAIIANTVKLMLQMGELHEEVVKPKRGPSTTRYTYVAG